MPSADPDIDPADLSRKALNQTLDGPSRHPLWSEAPSGTIRACDREGAPPAQKVRMPAMQAPTIRCLECCSRGVVIALSGRARATCATSGTDRVQPGWVNLRVVLMREESAQDRS